MPICHKINFNFKKIILKIELIHYLNFNFKNGTLIAINISKINIHRDIHILSI